MARSVIKVFQLAVCPGRRLFGVVMFSYRDGFGPDVLALIAYDDDTFLRRDVFAQKIFGAKIILPQEVFDLK